MTQQDAQKQVDDLVSLLKDHCMALQVTILGEYGGKEVITLTELDEIQATPIE